MLKPGGKTTEWWAVVAVMGLAGAKWLGLVPEDTSIETLADTGAKEAIPYLLDSFMKLADNNAPLLVAAGVVWAYIRRRYGLKAKDLKNEVSKRV